MPRLFATVQPSLLVWAREAAGLPLAAAARKLGVTEERLRDWESGETKLTVPQLRKAAQVYKRPLAVFFLPQPPAPVAVPHDFRSLDPMQAAPRSPELVLEVRRARRRRAIAVQITREAEQQIGESVPSATTATDPDILATRLREWLDVPVERQGTWRGEYAPLTGWIGAFEKREVLVFQTSEVALSEMRGFSISEFPLPAVVLNATDTPRGRVFTLIHELVHLSLRNGGVCDPVRVGSTGRTPNEQVEVFCNRVAGSLLIPADALLSHRAVRAAAGGQIEWAESILRDLADAFAVSREAVLRRLLILRRTTNEFYEQKREEYREQYVVSRQRQREQGGYAPYHRIVVRDLGRQYTKLVLDALDREQITAADVSDYLGVNLKHLGDISEAVQTQGAGGVT